MGHHPRRHPPTRARLASSDLIVLQLIAFEISIVLIREGLPMSAASKAKAISDEEPAASVALV